MKLKIRVDGKVQNVGFRYTTKMLADQLGVAGSVENNIDGSVTIEAVADDKTMAVFIEELKKGPSIAAVVEDLVIEENDSISDYEKFSILY